MNLHKGVGVSHMTCTVVGVAGCKLRIMHLPVLSISLALCFSIAALTKLAVGSLITHGGEPDERGFANFGGKISQFHHQLLQQSADSQKKLLEVKNGNSIMLHLDAYTNEVSEQFLSVTIDASAIRSNWKIINFTSTRVINLAKALHPAMLRVGGTGEDFIIFENDSEPRRRQGFHVHEAKSGECDGTSEYKLQPPTSNYTMNTSQWDAVNEFVRAVGWGFMFGLNVLLRKPWPNGTWDTYNAEQLLTYTTSKGYDVNWELGNEPDRFPVFAPDIPVSPQQDARDFKTLRSLVDEKSPTTKFIAGPDASSLSNGYFGHFLEAIEDDVINAATWHHYYGNGHTAILPNFFDVDILDGFIHACQEAVSYIQKYQPNVELWLGETSSYYAGGAPVLSSAYVAGFMWLDKLGIAALTNNTRVFRQEFIGAHDSLLNATEYPLPDYWLSLLHKKLVGTRVLYVLNSLETGRYIRAYAHCAKAPYPAGSVVLLLLNLNTYDTNTTLANTELASSSRDMYWLTPPGNTTNVLSMQVTLNGHLLQLVGDQLPELQPEGQEAKDSIFLPALSFGFHVFKDVKAPACM